MLTDPLELATERLLTALGMKESPTAVTNAGKAGPLTSIDRAMVAEIILIRDAAALNALADKFKSMSGGISLKDAVDARVGSLFGSVTKYRFIAICIMIAVGLIEKFCLCRI
jgi:hypothetical protein